MKKFILTESNLTLIEDGKSEVLNYNKSQKNKIIQLLGKNNFGAIKTLINAPEKCKLIDMQEKYQLTDVAKRMEGVNEFLLNHADSKIPLDYIHKFIELLELNPCEHSLTQSFNFIKNNGIKLSENGYIVGLRAVRNNYTDKHTGTINNRPQTFVSMKRKDVTHDPNHGCSFGLHVGNYDYVCGFAYGDDIIQVIIVHPKDIVSVPTECSSTKMRVCKYYILRDATKEDLNYFKSNESMCFADNIVLDFDKELLGSIKADINEIKQTSILKSSTEYKKDLKRVVRHNKTTTSKVKNLMETIATPKSEGRVSIPSKFMANIGATAKSVVYVKVCKNEIIITKDKIKDADFHYTTDGDNMLRIGHRVITKIKSNNCYKIVSTNDKIVISAA